MAPYDTLFILKSVPLQYNTYGLGNILSDPNSFHASDLQIMLAPTIGLQEKK